MSISDDIIAVSSGARFYRADLHIHSYPASHDVKDTAMTPDAIVARAIQEGLGLIAITDHNNISNVMNGIKAAEKSSLCVIPGVELTTGDGHLLVYFGQYSDLESFFGKLDIEGKSTPESRCTTSMLDCLKKIDLQKGFAILAHIDGGSGLEDSCPGFSPHKTDIMMSEALMGIELRAHDSVISYSDSDPIPERAQIGRKRLEALGLGTRQYLARCVFSDSHNLNALGKNFQGKKRVTRVKMESPCFEGLRIALQDADARVRIEDEIPESVPYILGVKLQGGFLDGQVIHFSRNLNCIIGGRGAGKSTAFEAVRCLSGTISGSKVVDSEVWPDTLHLVWVDPTGQQHVLVRRGGDKIVNTSDPLMGPTSFSMESYGQNETAQTSSKAENDPAELLAYLDKFVDLQQLWTQDEQLRADLLNNQTSIEKAVQQVNRIPEFQQLLAHTQHQLSALKAANAKDIVELEQKVAEERAIRKQLEQYTKDYSEWIKQASFTEDLQNIQARAKVEELRVGADNFKAISALAAALEIKANASQKTLAGEIASFVASVKQEIEKWKAKESTVLTEIETKRTELKAKGIPLDLPYIKKLAEDESSHKTSLANLKQWEAQLKTLYDARKKLLADRHLVRSTVSTKRTAFAIEATKALSGALSDLSVTVRFSDGAYSPEAEVAIQQAMGWKTSQVPRAALLTEVVTVPRLLECIQKTDPDPIVAVENKDGLKPFSKSDALEILRMLAIPANLHRLQRCIMEDRPRIIVTKTGQTAPGSKPVSRDFGRLSLGQQQSVLLALMLSSDSKLPLIIDQPEDNLDSEFIFYSLVPVLRAAKERRQIIVVTHNPNIAVLGDAELIVALKSTNDKSSIVARGSIDDPKTKKVVCTILEGAEEAFKRRAKMYGTL
jgi:ABC-type lipoprotein export system ATPase subunit